jgi:hypothetical protein
MHATKCTCSSSCIFSPSGNALFKRDQYFNSHAQTIMDLCKQIGQAKGLLKGDAHLVHLATGHRPDAGHPIKGISNRATHPDSA